MTRDDPVDESATSDGGGPRDLADVADLDLAEWVDLGSLLVPPNAGVDLQAQADPATGAISELSLAVAGGAVRVQPFAGPRSPGMWDDVRSQLTDSLASGGVRTTPGHGPFGPELVGQLPTPDGKGEPARFAGIDGPRWFLRLIYLGAATKPGATADRLTSAVRSLVVVRGSDAMPVGAPLALTLPASVAGPDAGSGDGSPDGAERSDRPRLTLPARGPEITEIR